ncbi:Nn.00g109540.m01.CDS01 [Neocucurbitaria sp. VM-36]
MIPVTRASFDSVERTSTFDIPSDSTTTFAAAAPTPVRDPHNGRLPFQRLQVILPPRKPYDKASLTTDSSAVIRRNSTLLFTVFGAAFGMQLAFDTSSDKIWDAVNRGRQWKDIKQRYLEQAEDDE